MICHLGSRSRLSPLRPVCTLDGGMTLLDGGTGLLDGGTGLLDLGRGLLGPGRGLLTGVSA